MKRIMFTLILVSSITCIFSGCARLPVYQSIDVTSVEGEFLTQECIMRYYDLVNKLEYGSGGMPGGGGGRSGGSGMDGGNSAMMAKMQQMQQPVDLWCTIIL